MRRGPLLAPGGVRPDAFKSSSKTACSASEPTADGRGDRQPLAAVEMLMELGRRNATAAKLLATHVAAVDASYGPQDAALSVDSPRRKRRRRAARLAALRASRHRRFTPQLDKCEREAAAASAKT